MKISAAGFYASFTRLFHDGLGNRLKHLDNRLFRDYPWWTKFMLHDFLPLVINDIGKGSLEYRHEFQNIDLCAWHNSGEEWDQARYGLPLYTHLMIEHENGPYPNQEFWKLLYLYAPLKVLVCYCYASQHNQWPQRDEYLKWLKQMHDRACSFHSRSADDAYLVIIGQRDVATPEELAWQGYEVKAGQQGLVQIN